MKTKAACFLKLRHLALLFKGYDGNGNEMSQAPLALSRQTPHHQ